MSESRETKQIRKIQIQGHANSSVLVIPKAVAKEYGMDESVYVSIEKQPLGILIRRLEV